VPSEPPERVLRAVLSRVAVRVRLPSELDSAGGQGSHPPTVPNDPQTLSLHRHLQVGSPVLWVGRLRPAGGPRQGDFTIVRPY
jgi:hypothetical protein